MALAPNSNTVAVKEPPRNRCDAVAHSSGHKKGLRTVAAIEFLKGILSVLLAFVFYEIIHKDVDLENAAQNLLYYLHINPDRRLSLIFIETAGKVMDANVAVVISVIFLYAAGRFIESYGLWRQRVWAEWLAIISGAIWIPLELYKLVRHPNVIHWVLLLINVVIVSYIAWVRWDEVSARHRAARARLAEESN